MKFKANKKANIKTDKGWILVYPGDIVDLPPRFVVHSGLDKVQTEVPKKEKEIQKEHIEPVKTQSYKDEEELVKMTKDELNDYACDIGLRVINGQMLKKTMITKIIEFIKGLLK